MLCTGRLAGFKKLKEEQEGLKLGGTRAEKHKKPVQKGLEGRKRVEAWHPPLRTGQYWGGHSTGCDCSAFKSRESMNRKMITAVINGYPVLNQPDFCWKIRLVGVFPLSNGGFLHFYGGCHVRFSLHPTEWVPSVRGSCWLNEIL